MLCNTSYLCYTGLDEFMSQQRWCMVAKRSWWQQIKQRRVTILVVAIILVATIALIIVGYRFDWTGFNGNSKSGKTLWDWLQLLAALAIPVVVGFGVVWFTARQGKVADAENKDNQRETALQAYIDKMSELILEKKLRDSAEEDEVRNIARVRTITVLTRLDTRRIGYVFTFLREAGPMSTTSDSSVVSLKDADLRTVQWGRADLFRADLRGTNLSGANLSLTNLSGAFLDGASLSDADLSDAFLYEANLSGAFLDGANLSGANLSDALLNGAEMRGANLSKANFSKANLSGANLEGVKNITTEELEKQAKSLKGATMPDGSIHP